MILLKQVNDLEQRNIAAREKHAIKTDVGAEIAKLAIGIPKKLSRSVGKLVEPDLTSEYQALVNEFNFKFNTLLTFVGTVPTRTLALTVNSQKLKKKFNKVHRASKLTTKVQKTV
ncbi:MAG: hypothetical protein ACFFD4_04370 [Candidatus Odinarchaeota archaeon]